MTFETVADRFEPLRVAGSGGMGVVYQARDRLTDDTVALKVLTGLGEEASRRFEREASLLRTLEHPAIVRYVGHGSPKGQHFLAMEWLEGNDLAERLAAGPLEVEEALELARRLADALAFVHERGLLHRDLKPGNVFLEGGDPRRAKLVDFGLARAPGDQSVTRMDQAIGTPAYMAPEQLLSEPLDPRTDVYGLGCLIFEALSGSPVFEGPVPLIINRILCVDPPRLEERCPQAPPALCNLVARMLAKDRGARPVDGRMVAAELHDLDAVVAQGISHAERRLVSFVEVVFEDADPAKLELIGTIAGDYRGALVERAQNRFVLLFAQGTAEDRAVMATRAALACHNFAPSGRIHVRTMQRAIDELTADGVMWPSARSWSNVGVGVDEATEQLLPLRFFRTQDSGWRIIEEQRELDLPRVVNGRVPPLVGRGAELERLAGSAFSAFRAHAARVALLTGEPGSGTSRLRQEALCRVARSYPDISIVTARGDAAFEHAPLGALRSVLQRLAWAEGVDAAADEQRLRERVGRNVPDALFADVFSPLADLIARAPSPERDATNDVAALARRVEQALAAFLSVESFALPTIVVIEDAHEVDARSLEVFARLPRALAEARIAFWFIGPSEITPTLCGAVASLPPGIVEHIELSPFEECERAALFRGALGPSASQELVDAGLSSGLSQPRMIEEWAIAYEEAGTTPQTTTPLEARLELLPADLRHTLRAASLIGRVLWLDALRALLDESRSVAADVDALVRLGWIVDRGPSRLPGQRELAFASEAAWKAAEAGLDGRDCVRGHGIVGRWLERRDDFDDGVVAAHMARAGAIHVAAVHYARAAKHALAERQFLQAVEHASRGLSCGPDPCTEGWLCALHASGLLACGERTRALKRAKEAMRVLEGHELTRHPHWFEAAAQCLECAVALGDRETRAAVVAALLATIGRAGVIPEQLAAVRVALRSADGEASKELTAFLERASP